MKLDASPDPDTLSRFSFGDSPALADELLDLVLQGFKTGTCWSVRDGQQTEVGQYWIVLDGAGRPRAVTETLALEQVRYCDVTPEFAHSEGEGDRTLAYWRDVHRAYFERTGGFAEDMMLWCETFRLVRVLTAEGATIDRGSAPPTSAS
jgi:uncharacterized protein YhfF